MELEFVMRKKRYQASRERVIEALREVEPEPATPYMVTIEGTTCPLRQAFAEVFTNMVHEPAERILPAARALHDLLLERGLL